MTDPIAKTRAAVDVALDRLVDAAHRTANEHAHALDALRAENEALRAQNAALRERLQGLGAPEQRKVLTGYWRGYSMIGTEEGRHAVHFGGGIWTCYHPDGTSPPSAETPDKSAALAWVLDGVLP